MEEIGYKKVYRMRSLLPTKRHITVAIPFEVIERQASLRGMTVPDFVEKYVAVCEFNSFEGVHYTFKEIDNDGVSSE